MAHSPPNESSQTAPPSLGKPFIELQSVDSTNNYARSLVDQQLAEHGTAVFAHAQWKGKGQRGKQWESAPGENITLSLIIEPSVIEMQHPFWLSASIALGLTDFFSGLAGQGVTIKWPNDLYWKDKKAGGILIENIISSEWKWSIVGIGININQVDFPASLPNPVSLKQVTGKKYDPVALAKELCHIIDAGFSRFREQGFDEILSSYNDRLYKKGETIKLKKDNRSFEAKLKGVSVLGNLIVDHGIENEYSYEEVVWIQ